MIVALFHDQDIIFIIVFEFGQSLFKSSVQFQIGCFYQTCIDIKNIFTLLKLFISFLFDECGGFGALRKSVFWHMFVYVRCSSEQEHQTETLC